MFLAAHVNSQLRRAGAGHVAGRAPKCSDNTFRGRRVFAELPLRVDAELRQVCDLCVLLGQLCFQIALALSVLAELCLCLDAELPQLGELLVLLALRREQLPVEVGLGVDAELP